MDLKLKRNRFLRKTLEIGQGLRIDVLPHHFYSPIPDFKDLRERDDWREPRSMIGVLGMDVEEQLRYLRNMDFGNVPDDLYEHACQDNGARGFSPVDAVVLYGFIAKQRPKRVVQVGAGVATAVMLRAAKDHDFEISITCIDPFPTELLHRLADRNEIHLIAERAQTVPLEELTACGPGDFLLIDSTHTVKPGSEVNRLILEVLPRLNPGVLIQVHDVTWPFDYPRDLLGDRLFLWEESTVLHAFLVNNNSFTVRICMSLLHYEAPSEVKALVPVYNPQRNKKGLGVGFSGGPLLPEGPHFPCSLYMEVLTG
jgi:predicted O-methyltransferase YrrM